ncbi:MAG: TIM barrel protein, partial [Armatimonadetes bacterium]|nr:TIM barrel protein [Armatimonadota bacterium]
MATLPVCLQAYTVRDDSAQDFYGTIKKVADIGYVGIELAGIYGKDATELRTVLDDNGLMVPGAHVGLGDLANVEAALETYNTLGAKYLIVPFLPAEMRTSMDDYRKLAETLSDLGAKVNKAGMGFAYHNHDFEFETFGGDQTAFDLLFESTDASVVKVELDAFWVKKAGLDPVAYMNKYAGRVPLVHLKDMTEDGKFAQVGEGTT